MIARFWWGGEDTKRKIHWWTWHKLCASKSDGGLGFRNLEVFNQAMLAKQCWQIIHNPASLVAKVLKDRYFPNHSFLQAQMGNNPSYIWRSFLWGRELLSLGLR